MIESHKHIDREDREGAGEVFVILPPESNTTEGYLGKVNKCIYGLSGASLKWYSKVNKFVNSNSETISKVDPSLFLWYNESEELIGYILVHVDDFLFAGNKDFHKTMITKLKRIFLIGKEAKLSFKYLGLNVTSIDSTITRPISVHSKIVQKFRLKQIERKS